MSKVDNNPTLGGQKGMLGRTIVFRQVNGRTICSSPPKKRDKPTEHQLKTKDKFMKGVEYARSQMANPELKALYKKAVNTKIPNAYTAALKDYLNAPVVKSIKTDQYNGQVGSMLYFLVADDFEVRSVTVEIFDATGRLLESGEAQKWDLHMHGWEYQATAANDKVTGSRVVVTGKDRPGNATVKELLM